MYSQVKSLVTISQDTLTKYLDVLTEIGAVPYSLLKSSFQRATPQQLYRIEKANPTLLPETDELWLSHCLTFRNIREEYKNKGMHRDPSEWRELYLRTYKENEQKRQLIKQKIKGQYNKIQHERQARSIKVLNGIVSTKERTYDAARRSTMSKLFQQTKKEADKITSIYRTNTSHKNIQPLHKPPSQFIRSYKPHVEYNRDRTPSSPWIPPKSNITTHKRKSIATDEPQKKKMAQVNYSLFKELS